MVTPEALPDDERYMQLALQQATCAEQAGDVPVGCVLVRDSVVVATGFNQREALQDPTAHAEMVAIRMAASQLGSWRLLGVTAYVTLEPCAMCAGALVLARVDRVVYGCADPKTGAVDTLYAIGSDPRLNHRFEVTANVLHTACSQQLKDFFATIRAAAHSRKGL
jgi:tRNA(adenine34) deaminase